MLHYPILKIGNRQTVSVNWDAGRFLFRSVEELPMPFAFSVRVCVNVQAARHLLPPTGVNVSVNEATLLSALSADEVERPCDCNRHSGSLICYLLHTIPA